MPAQIFKMRLQNPLAGNPINFDKLATLNLFTAGLLSGAFGLRAATARLKKDGARASRTTERSLPRWGKQASPRDIPAGDKLALTLAKTLFMCYTIIEPIKVNHSKEWDAKLQT